MPGEAAHASKKARVIAWGIGTIMAVAAATGAWFFIDSQEQVSCEELARNNALRAALDGRGSVSSCGELGEAIKRATMGASPGRHSEKQAQAMKDVLLAIKDATADKKLESDLQIPVSEALADYAADTRTMLASGNAEYVLRSGDSEGPWTDKEGVHVAVFHEDLLRVLRIVSDDPTAYANLRAAVTEQAAHELASVPDDPTSDELSAPPTTNSRVLAAFDAIAADVNRERDKSETNKWEADVYEKLTEVAAVPPTFRADATGYITATWRQELKEAGVKNTWTSLRDQGLALTETWAKARGLDTKTVTALRNQVTRSSQAGFNSTERDLK